MAIETHIIPMTCFGRNSEGKNALSTAVNFNLVITRPPEDSQCVSISAESCPHNTGSGKQRCKASYAPGIDKIGEGIICPYTLDIPYGVDILIRQQIKS